VAIIEVKTSISLSKLRDNLIPKAREQLKGYLKGDWKAAKCGIIMPIHLKDFDEMIETEFKSGIVCLLDENNYEEYVVKP